MFFIRYKNHPPVNLDLVFDIKTTRFQNSPKGDVWVISFFPDADGKESLQWQFRSEEERNHVYQNVLDSLPQGELTTIPQFND